MDKNDIRWPSFEFFYSPISWNFQKNALNDPKWPWHIQGQKYQHACYIHARGPNFCAFHYTMSRFLVTGQFLEKCTEWPQMTLTCSRSKIPIRMLDAPPRPKFLFVSLYNEPLLLYWPIFGKLHRMAPNDLDMFKVKNTNMHVTYIPEAKIFVHFTRWLAVFELRPNCWKSALNDLKWPWNVQGQKCQHARYIHPRGPNFHPFRSTISHFWVMAQFSEKCTEWPQMTLTCSRSKIPICMLHTPQRLKFSSVSLYDEPFVSYGPISGKVHRMTPNDHDIVRVKNTNMHAICTPEFQIFVRFTLRWAVFKEIEIFEFPIGYNVKKTIISDS